MGGNIAGVAQATGFAERLKLLLKRKNITQRELARRMNVHFRTISNYATGQREPSLSALHEISTILNTPIGYFFGEGESKNYATTHPRGAALSDVSSPYLTGEHTSHHAVSILSSGMIRQILEDSASFPDDALFAWKVPADCHCEPFIAGDTVLLLNCVDSPATARHNAWYLVLPHAGSGRDTPFLTRIIISGTDIYASHTMHRIGSTTAGSDLALFGPAVRLVRTLH